jgi:organic radical activating enzyme
MDIIIETTRQCNLSCEHCLRGDAENMSIDRAYVESLFSQVDEISCLTLTGGEPALRPDKINMILDVAEQYGVDILNFFIATNGTIATLDFIMALIRLHHYCSDNEISMVLVSNDVFHDTDKIRENIRQLQVLSFVDYRNPVETKADHSSYDYGNYQNILFQGRGEAFCADMHPVEKTIADIMECPEDAEFYLNCHGDIILGCDWSYENQDEHRLCHVSDLHEFLAKIPA